MPVAFDLPHLGWGVGLRAAHTQTILDTWPDVDWFEVITENVMESRGRPRAVVEAVAERYPIVLHGVSLNIGSTDPLDGSYLDSLASLIETLRPSWVSDHLCWNGVLGRHTHDLLPIPYTEQTLTHVVDRVRRVQDRLGRPLVLENPSSYVTFRSSTMPEWAFLARLAEQADCGLLLDVNNVAVSCFNHGWDAQVYLDAIPADRIVQFHLAGHSDLGTHRIDTHDAPVTDEVWALYRSIYARVGGASTLIEWDADLPPFQELLAEADRAKAVATGSSVTSRVRPSSSGVPHPLHHAGPEVAS